MNDKTVYVCENCGSQYDSLEELDRHICEEEPSEEILEQLSKEPKDEEEEEYYEDVPKKRKGYKYQGIKGTAKEVIKELWDKGKKEEILHFVKFLQKKGEYDQVRPLITALATVESKEKLSKQWLKTVLGQVTESIQELAHNPQACPFCGRSIQNLNANPLLIGSEAWRKQLGNKPKVEGQSGQVEQKEWSEIVTGEEHGYLVMHKDLETTPKVILSHIRYQHKALWDILRKMGVVQDNLLDKQNKIAGDTIEQKEVFKRGSEHLSELEELSKEQRTELVRRWIDSKKTK